MTHPAEKNPATDATRGGVLAPPILGARGPLVASSSNAPRLPRVPSVGKEKHRQPGDYLPDGCATPERAGDRPKEVLLFHCPALSLLSLFPLFVGAKAPTISSLV